MNLQNRDIQQLLNETISWAKNHRDTVVSAAAAAAVVIAFAVYFVVHTINTRQEAQEKLSFGQIYAMNNAGDQAMRLFDDIISNYGSTGSAPYAKLFKADLLFRMKRIPEALKIYNDLMAGSRNNNILIFAYIGAGSCSEAAGNSNDAIRIYSEAIQKFPEHYYIPRLYELIGESYVTSGLLSQARDSYEKLITLYPGTTYAKIAQGKISEFQKSAPQPKEVK